MAALDSGIITNAGLPVVADHIWGNGSGSYLLYVAYGTGTTAVTVYDTVMETEVARAEATVIDTSNRLNLQAAFTISGSTLVSEVGVFTALTGGIMVFHGVADTDNDIDFADGATLTVSIILSPESV